MMCVECGAVADDRAEGRGYRADDPREDEPAELVFFCPTCAEQEFGDRRTDADEQA